MFSFPFFNLHNMGFSDMILRWDNQKWMIADMESCQKKEKWKLVFSIQSFMMVISGKKKKR